MNLHSLARSCPASREVLVRRVCEMHWTVQRAADAAEISVRSAYKWLERHRVEGWSGLKDRSSRPRTTTRTSPEWEKLVIELRQTRMTSPLIARRLRMSHSTVARILCRAGLNRLRALDPKEPVVRYERARPGELVHVDIKKLGRFRRVGHRIHGIRNEQTQSPGIGWEFVHVCIDDATRLAYVEVLGDERGATAAAFLRRAAAWYRRYGITIERVMSDNGSGYVSKDFKAACAELEARHLRTKPYCPKTNGKAERFIQTLLREWAYALAYETSEHRRRALPRWLRFYNRSRPHGGLHGKTPWEKLSQSRVNNLVRLDS